MMLALLAASELDRLTADAAYCFRKRLPEILCSARAEPLSLLQGKMQASSPTGEPHLLRRAMAVDDNLLAVVKLNIHHIARTVDIGIES